MDVKKYPPESDKIFLADLTLEFKEMEGDVDGPDDRAWVIIRQAGQGDNMKRADLLRNREVKYGVNDSGLTNTVARVYNDNILRRRMEEVRLTLKDYGNLTANGEPLFPKMPAKEMPRAKFEEIWSDLHPTIAEAIHLAVLQINVAWAFEGE